MEKTALPEAYKTKAWAGSVCDEEGNFSMDKALSKIEGQESLLGKKHIPGKDATAEQRAAFNADVVKEYQDGDYDAVLGECDNKPEMIKALKDAGMTPAQAKIVADREVAARKAGADSVRAVEYDEEKFKEKVRASMTEAEYNKAEKVLKKTGQWDKTIAARNDEALERLIMAGKIGVDYDVDDAPGKGAAADPSNVQSNGKGYCQEYVDRIPALIAQGKTPAEATKIAKAEFGVE